MDTSLCSANQTSLLSLSIHFLGRDLTLGLPTHLATLIMRRLTWGTLPWPSHHYEINASNTQTACRTCNILVKKKIVIFAGIWHPYYELDFSQFNVTLTRDMPFAIPQYVQCILHGLTSALLCFPLIFADSKKYRFGGCTRWLPLCNRNCPYFSQQLPWLQRCFLSRFVLLCNESNIAANKA